MGKILSSKKLYKIDDELNEYINKINCLDNNIKFFPIRHHSVGCSYHLEKVINEYNPEAILVEGPDNTNHLLNSIVNDNNKTPLCIYYSYHDKKKILDKEENKYTCYYPLLSYSPEYIAIKKAIERDIHVSFIDLPYEKTLIASKEGKGLRIQNKKSTYSNDDYIQYSEYNHQLFKNTGVRNFHEFWEKYFEIDAKYIDTNTYINNMLTYCFLIRKYSKNNELLEDGCIAREKYMTENIESATKKYKKILVVTGGFHTSGIINILNNNEPLVKDINSKKCDLSEYSKSYLMAYSYEASDQLLGYKSGMPYSSFYKKIWDNIKEEKTYEEVIKYYIAKTNRTLRKDNLPLSTDDSINALLMAKGLSNIRNKKEPGVNELIEGVTSSFVKGELCDANNKPINVLKNLMIGNKIGQINTEVDKPPLLQDFYNLANKFKLDLQNISTKLKILDLSKISHVQLSYFFHRMSYLDCNYCFMNKGPNLTKKSNMYLKRETWQYKYNEKVISKLIELSVHGGSVLEVCMELLKEEGKNAKGNSFKSSNILLKSVVMGLDMNIEKLVNEVTNSIFADNNYLNIISAFEQIHYTLEIIDDTQSKTLIEKLLNICYKKSISLLDFIEDVDVERENSYLKAIVNHNYISEYITLDKDLFLEKIKFKLDNIKSTMIYGGVVGILYGFNNITQEKILDIINSYIKASGEEKRKMAPFLRGLFTTGRDVMLYDRKMINLLDEYLKDINDENFIEILPELRYAFSIFMPREIDKIAKGIGQIYNLSGNSIAYEQGIDVEDIKIASIIDNNAKNMLAKWGVIDG